jgi:hypothetical protein
MTATPNLAVEGEAYIMYFDELYEELEALERRVIMQIQHIQHIRLETDGGEYHLGEKREEAGDLPTEELTEANMLEEEVEKQETVELESTTEWKTNST